ncbi:MAG: hypothetical protein V4543_17455 [Bacteroidota bacterium]
MRAALLLLLCLTSGIAIAQDSTIEAPETGNPDSTGTKMTLGEGINFQIGSYRFKFSGMLQPSVRYNKTDGIDRKTTLNTKRTYLNFGGNALKEKISFFVQADFSASTPLLDAWVAYNFTPRFSLTAGQKRTFTNNREMTFNEDKLQFADRGMVSTAFTGNGREFGLFLEGKLGTSFIIAPQIAITSGDGPNSFGTSSSDMDLGGFKYGGRLDIYPLGDFKEGNSGFTADLKHEDSPKFVLGISGSLNKGASNAKGEGHGNFLFYNAAKAQQLPDLRKLHADVLLKYQGVSLLAEYTNSSAAGLKGAYLDSTANTALLLKPGQISQYLILGNAYNVSLGYATLSGYALDLRYEKLSPEFSDQAGSLLAKTDVQTIGLSRYFKDNKLKVQASASSVHYANSVNAFLAELMFQVVF